MKAKTINIVFVKEITEFVRDRRTMLIILLLPFFLYPSLFYYTKNINTQVKQESVISNNTFSVLIDNNVDKENLFYKYMITNGVGVNIGKVDSQGLIDNKINIGVKLYQLKDQHTELDLINVISNSISSMADEYKIMMLVKNFNEQTLENENSLPLVKVKEVQRFYNNDSKIIMKSFAYLIFIMILLTSFFAIFYIAIDITAGEKERRTFQTLLTTPANLKDIVIGKFLATLLVSFVILIINFLCFYLCFIFIPSSFLQIDIKISSLGGILAMLLVFSTVVLLASLFLSLVLFSNTTKEAQSYTYPLMILMFLPLISLFFSNISVESIYFSLVPFLNYYMSSIILFEVNNDLLIFNTVTIVVNLLWSLLFLLLSARIFKKINLV